MVLPSLLSSAGLILSFAFSKMTDVVRKSYKYICRPYKPYCWGEGGKREKLNLEILKWCFHFQLQATAQAGSTWKSGKSW